MREGREWSLIGRWHQDSYDQRRMKSRYWKLILRLTTGFVSLTSWTSSSNSFSTRDQKYYIIPSILSYLEMPSCGLYSWMESWLNIIILAYIFFPSEFWIYSSIVNWNNILLPKLLLHCSLYDDLHFYLDAWRILSLALYFSN